MKRPLLAGVVLGLLHALLFGCAFEPVGLGLLAPLSLFPLGVLALRTERPWRSALGAGLASMPMWGYHEQFLWKMTQAGVFPLVVYLALYPALFVWLVARIHRAMPGLSLVILFPIVWTGLETLRGEVVWDGYAWYLVAQPMISVTAVSSWASIVGVYGVGSMLAMGVGWCLEARRWSREGKEAPAHAARGALLSIAGITLCGAVVLGAGSLGPPPMSVLTRSGPSVRVAAVQTNVPQDNRARWHIEDQIEVFQSLSALTRLAAQQTPKPDLIVWPETMFPGSALNEEAVRVERGAGLQFAGHGPTTMFYDGLLALQREVGVPIIVGARAIEGLRISALPGGGVDVQSDKEFNSAFVVENGRVAERRYDKIRLTPFGEVMPYISRWDWLEKQLLALGGNGMTFSLEAGSSATCLEIDAPAHALAAAGKPQALRIAAPICYEVADQEVCRRLVYQGGVRKADLMASPSNDGWFDWFDPGRAHLLLMARWRCVENGTPMIRSANTGLSAAIDAWGQLVALGPNVGDQGAAGPTHVEGVVQATLALPSARATPFATVGNALGWGCLGAMLMMGVMALVRSGPGSRTIEGSGNGPRAAAGPPPAKGEP